MCTLTGERRAGGEKVRKHPPWWMATPHSLFISPSFWNIGHSLTHAWSISQTSGSRTQTMQSAMWDPATLTATSPAGPGYFAYSRYIDHCFLLCWAISVSGSWDSLLWEHQLGSHQFGKEVCIWTEDSNDTLQGCTLRQKPNLVLIPAALLRRSEYWVLKWFSCSVWRDCRVHDPW